MTRQNPIPKTIALILVSIFGAWLMMKTDASTLAKMDSMSAADYIQHQRELHHHSFVFHFVMALMLGGFYIGIIEFITYLLGLLFNRQTPA